MFNDFHKKYSKKNRKKRPPTSVVTTYDDEMFATKRACILHVYHDQMTVTTLAKI